MFKKISQASLTIKVLSYSFLFLIWFVGVAIGLASLYAVFLTNILANQLKWNQNFIHSIVSILNWIIALFLSVGIWIYFWEKNLKNKGYIRDTKHSALGKSEWLIDMSQKQIPLSQHTAFNTVYPQMQLPGFVICVETNIKNELFFHQAIKVETTTNNDKRKKVLNVENQHILILGGSGSGKTQNIIMPTIYWNARLVDKPNMVISDVKGELTEKFSDFLKKQGYTVYVFDLINALSDTNNTCLNPLLEIKKDYINYLNEKSKNALLITEIENRINMLIATLLPISSEKDSFWIREARNIVKGLLWMLLEIIEIQKRFSNKKSKDWISDQQFSFSNINNLLTNTKTIKETVDMIIQLKPQSKAYQFLANSLFVTEATSSGFLAHCQDALAIFYDYGIEYLTSNTTIDFADFFTKPSVIFIKTSATEKANYPIAGMIVNSLCYYAQKIVDSVPEKKLKKELLFVLDEFANFPVIQDFDTKISTYRSCNIFFALVLQSLNQLKKYQNQAKTILDNLATKVYLHVELEDAKTISETIGDKTIVRTSYSSAETGKKDGNSKSESISNVRLIHPSDITHLPQNYGIVVSAKQNPSLVKFTPAYKTPIKNIQNKVCKKIQPIFNSENDWLDINQINWKLQDCLRNKIFSKMRFANNVSNHNIDDDEIDFKDENNYSENQETGSDEILDGYYNNWLSNQDDNLKKQIKTQLRKHIKILQNWQGKNLNRIQNEIEYENKKNNDSSIDEKNKILQNLVFWHIVNFEDSSENHIEELINFLNKKIKNTNKT